MHRYLPVLLLLPFFACKDKKYCACCENPGLSARITLNYGPAHPDSLATEALIYVPNILVYDDSGINDLFMVFSNFAVVEIVSFEGKDSKGNRLFLFQHFYPSDTRYGWNGLTSGGTRYEGSFDYTLVAKLYNGQVKTLEGSACAFPCGDKGFPKSQVDGCQFNSQNNGNGEFDPTQPGGAPGCFE